MKLHQYFFNSRFNTNIDMQVSVKPQELKQKSEGKTLILNLKIPTKKMVLNLDLKSSQSQLGMKLPKRLSSRLMKNRIKSNQKC